MKATEPPIALRFKEAQDAYERVSLLCLPHVIRWEYATDVAWGWHPFCAGEGKSLAPTGAGEDDADFAYGHDAAGRVRVVRSHLRVWRKFPGSRPCETFLQYSPVAIEVWEFGPKQLIAVETVALAGGRAVGVERFDHEGTYRRIAIEWDGDRVAKYRWTVPKLGVDRVRVLDERGRTREEHEVADDSRDTVKPEVLRKRLLNAVRRAAGSAGIREKVYCLVLAYDGEGDVLPPLLGFGLERERRQWLSQHGRRARELLWNPAEYTHYEKPHTQLNDEGLEADCRRYNHLLRARGSPAPARDLLNVVAAELGRADWTGALDTTDDFVAFAVDFEGRDRRRNMKRSVPPDRLATLKAAGLI
ncbi:MAG TPA: hypothetical protein VFB66_17440 [Tepidisphaeraceae bacterium]|nr:hypothetical protein [Tepidisphaeraceae bacterium]